ncbi:MAG: hypothetical protein Q8K98_00700 [Bacteroidota bacterium]|nr:hypothetical protein [Bacteroidota bacterium]
MKRQPHIFIEHIQDIVIRQLKIIGEEKDHNEINESSPEVDSAFDESTRRADVL